MFKGLVLCAMGIGLIILCVMAYIAWWGLCFGSILLGIVLLIFAPRILFLPNFIGVSGLALLLKGLENIFGNYKDIKRNLEMGFNVSKHLKLIAEHEARRKALNQSPSSIPADFQIVKEVKKSEFEDQTEVINARREAINLPPLPRKSEVDDDDSLPF